MNQYITKVNDMSPVNTAMKAGGKAMFGAQALDAATAGGMAFLVGQLEKVDPKLREPLTSVTWQRDAVAKTGGGWVEYTSTYDLNYGIAGPNSNGIMEGSANNIPVMQADIGKNQFKVFTWGNSLKVPYINLKKLEQIARNIEDILNSGIRLNYNKTVDENLYTGFTQYGTTGLVNDPNVVAASVPAGTGGTTWKGGKTPDEILNDINSALTAAWTAAEYDLRGMPNHILIPPEQYAFIVNQKVSEAGNVSILTYLLENNIAKNQGVDLQILPSRWCKGAGTGSTDRMIVYVNDEDMMYFDLPVPLARVMTAPSVADMAFLTAYAAQIGQLKFLYYQPVRYFDGI